MVFNPAAAVDAFISYLIAKANISLPVACAILAVLSGLCNTVSVLVITYPAHQAASKGVKRTALGSGASFVGNLALMGVSISLGIAANGRGPVAIAFPLGVGSNLLSIMILQTALGIAHYTKNMRVGTLVLACAVMILPDVGPLDLPPGADALSLLEAKPAMMFNSVCTVLMGVGFYAILRGWVKDNDSLLFLYALVGGAGTVLSTAISKLVQLNVGFGVLIALLIIYVLLGAFCLLLAATANSTLEDPSMFVPVSAGVNLVLTFIAGVCIWGDWLRITNPLAYVMVYVLIVLGTYLVSSFGGVGNSHVKVAQDHVDAAEVVTKDCWDSLELSSIRASDCDLEATKHLIQLWGDSSRDNHAKGEALKHCLRRGLECCVIGNAEVIDLCMTLAQEPGDAFQSSDVKEWITRHLPSSQSGRSDDTVGKCSESLEMRPRKASKQSNGLDVAASVVGASTRLEP